jgi:hypothetical protein
MDSIPLTQRQALGYRALSQGAPANLPETLTQAITQDIFDPSRINPVLTPWIPSLTNESSPLASPTEVPTTKVDNNGPTVTDSNPPIAVKTGLPTNLPADHKINRGVLPTQTEAIKDPSMKVIEQFFTTLDQLPSKAPIALPPAINPTFANPRATPASDPYLSPIAVDTARQALQLLKTSLIKTGGDLQRVFSYAEDSSHFSRVTTKPTLKGEFISQATLDTTPSTPTENLLRDELNEALNTSLRLQRPSPPLSSIALDGAAKISSFQNPLSQTLNPALSSALPYLSPINGQINPIFWEPVPIHGPAPLHARVPTDANTTLATTTIAPQLPKLPIESLDQTAAVESASAPLSASTALAISPTSNRLSLLSSAYSVLPPTAPASSQPSVSFLANNLVEHQQALYLKDLAKPFIHSTDPEAIVEACLLPRTEPSTTDSGTHEALALSPQTEHLKNSPPHQNTQSPQSLQIHSSQQGNPSVLSLHSLITASTSTYSFSINRPPYPGSSLTRPSKTVDRLPVMLDVASQVEHNSDLIAPSITNSLLATSPESASQNHTAFNPFIGFTPPTLPQLPPLMETSGADEPYDPSKPHPLPNGVTAIESSPIITQNAGDATMLTTEPINASLRITPLDNQLLPIQVTASVARDLGLRDGQIVQGVIEEKGDSLTLSIQGLSIELPKAGPHPGIGETLNWRAHETAKGMTLTNMGLSSLAASAEGANAAAIANTTNIHSNFSGGVTTGADPLPEDLSMGNLSLLMRPNESNALASLLTNNPANPNNALSTSLMSLLGALPSMAQLTQDNIRVALSAAGLWTESQLGRSGPISNKDMKVTLGRLLKTTPSDDPKAHALKEGINDIHSSQLKALEAQMRGELFFQMQLPFADANPVRLTISRQAPSLALPRPPYVFEAYTNNAQLGEMWLKSALDSERKVDLNMWAHLPEVAALAKAQSGALFQQLQLAGLTLTSLTVHNGPRPSDRPSSSAPGMIFNLEV